jgi:hypothetical protein
MDVLAAYREVGTYRGAAGIFGTTHKTVKRIVEGHNAGGGAVERRQRGPQLRRRAHGRGRSGEADRRQDQR